jgi:hypothetical protein
MIHLDNNNMLQWNIQEKKSKPFFPLCHL